MVLPQQKRRRLSPRFDVDDLVVLKAIALKRTTTEAVQLGVVYLTEVLLLSNLRYWSFRGLHGSLWTGRFAR